MSHITELYSRYPADYWFLAHYWFWHKTILNLVGRFLTTRHSLAFIRNPQMWEEYQLNSTEIHKWNDGEKIQLIGRHDSHTSGHDYTHFLHNYTFIVL